MITYTYICSKCSTSTKPCKFEITSSILPILGKAEVYCPVNSSIAEWELIKAEVE